MTNRSNHIPSPCRDDATVDRQHCTVDEIRLIREQKSDGLGDILRPTVAAERNALGALLIVLGWSTKPAVAGVGTEPGAITLTRMPRGPSSPARTLLIAATAPLIAV